MDLATNQGIKVLRAGTSWHGGEQEWSLPTRATDGAWTPGKWTPAVGQVAPEEEHVVAADGSTIWRKADEDDGGGLPHVRSVPAEDMVGSRVGKWLVLALATPSAVGRTRYLCRCECGTERPIGRDALRGQHPSRSCRPCARKAIGLAARGRKRRAGAGQGRPATISLRRSSVRDHALSLLEYPVAEHATYDRPLVRGDCLAGGSNEARPCPWVSCAYHLALDVSEDSGNIKVTFPGVEIEALAHTCALDLADGEGATLDEIGAAQNISRERVRQIELEAIEHLRAEREMRRLA